MSVPTPRRRAARASLVTAVFLVVELSATRTAQAADSSFPSARDIYKWPFSANSIWNMPIGSNAVYVPAGLQEANAWGGRVGVDPEDISIDPAFPVRTVTTTEGGPTGIRAHVDPTLEDHGLQNDTAALLSADDHNLVWMGQPLTVAPGGNPSWKWTTPEHPVALDGDGRPGSHGGSGLSSLGGSIRPGELSGGPPIRHALKVNVYARKYLSPGGSPPGYRWPAYQADRYWNETDPATGRWYYDGPLVALRMGSLLALRPEANLSFVTHPKVQKLAFALQNYGVYVVDDSAWDVYDMSVDVAALKRGEWPAIENDPSFHAQLQGLFTMLHVVDNNGPESIGGGGVARQPLAPPFGPAVVVPTAPVAAPPPTSSLGPAPANGARCSRVTRGRGARRRTVRVCVARPRRQRGASAGRRAPTSRSRAATPVRRRR